MQGPHNQLQLQLAHLHIRLGMSPCFLKSDHYTILYYAKSDPIQNLIMYSTRHEPTQFCSCVCHQVPAPNLTSNPAPNPAPAPAQIPASALDLVTAQNPMTQSCKTPIRTSKPKYFEVFD